MDSVSAENILFFGTVSQVIIIFFVEDMLMQITNFNEILILHHVLRLYSVRFCFSSEMQNFVRSIGSRVVRQKRAIAKEGLRV